MIPSGYPIMMQSEWDNAPFNQDITYIHYKELIMSQTLSKVFENVPCDQTNPTEEQATEALDNDHRYSIEQLLTKSGEVLTEMREFLRKLQQNKELTPQENFEINRLFLNSSRVISQLSGWDVDETTVMEN